MGSERFLILTRSPDTASQKLYETLCPLGPTEVIADTEGTDEVVFYPDEEVEGFSGLLDTFFPKSACTAWGKAMFHLSKTLKAEDEAVWFVEDDVAGGHEYFATLVEETATYGADLSANNIRPRDRDSQWCHWHLAKDRFEDPWASFMPLCRISAELVEYVLDYRQRNGEFAFLELMFASVAAQKGLSRLDWGKDFDFARLFSRFKYRPAITHVFPGICHPVKNQRVHSRISNLGFSPPPRRAQIRTEARSKLKNYKGETDLEWLIEELPYWRTNLFSENPVKTIQICSDDGKAANLLLEVVFPHRASEMYCLIDPDHPLKPEDHFEENASIGENLAKLHLYEGHAPEVLAWMVSQDQFYEQCDLVHLLGPLDRGAFLCSICQAWLTLKPGGALVLSPQIAKMCEEETNAFYKSHRHQIQHFQQERPAVMVKSPY